MPFIMMHNFAKIKGAAADTLFQGVLGKSLVPCNHLKNVGPFNLVHLSPSLLLFPFAVFLLCCSTVLIGQFAVCFIYFLGILLS